MHICLELYRTLQTVIYYRGQVGPKVDPSSDAHLHEHPKHLYLVTPRCVFIAQSKVYLMTSGKFLSMVGN